MVIIFGSENGLSNQPRHEDPPKNLQPPVCNFLQPLPEFAISIENPPDRCEVFTILVIYKILLSGLQSILYRKHFSLV